MIAIISAMHEEMFALQEKSKITKTLIKGRRTFYQGLLFDTEVVIVFSRWGKVAAATTTTQLLNSFPISNVIFSGVAGGLVPSLNIGDIVIGTKLIQYDMDASPLYPAMEIPLLGVTAFEAADTCQLKKAAEYFLADYSKLFSAKIREDYKIKTPKIHKGLIVSGDHFVNSKDKIKEITSLAPKALCVEMEGAAVAQVCYEYNVPFQIMRIISDKANDNSHIDFPKFANEIAGKYALEILRNYLKNA